MFTFKDTKEAFAKLAVYLYNNCHKVNDFDLLAFSPPVAFTILDCKCNIDECTVGQIDYEPEKEFPGKFNKAIKHFNELRELSRNHWSIDNVFTFIKKDDKVNLVVNYNDLDFELSRLTNNIFLKNYNLLEKFAERTDLNIGSVTFMCPYGLSVIDSGDNLEYVGKRVDEFFGTSTDINEYTGEQ